LALGKVVFMTIIQKLMEEKGVIKDFTPSNIEKFLKENFTSEYLKTVIEAETNKVLEGYIKVTTSGMTQEQKNHFNAQIRQVN